MAGLNFVVTVDNSPFMDSMKGIRKGVETTMDLVEKAGGSIEDLGAVSKRVFNILDQVGKNFNVEGVKNQIVALSKVIRDNEAIITQSKDKLIQWAEQAQEAQKAGDTGLFESITKDMKAELGTMQELIKETNEYKLALNEIKAVNDIYSTGEKAPMLFNTQEEFDRVERLKTGISELLSTIANFDGSEKDLLGLRLELSGMQEELRQCELNAAEAAAKLGEGGQAAAEASQKFFTLNKAVEEQTGVVAEMANKLNVAATELENAKAGGDLSAIEDAQIKYDMLSESLQDAKMNLIGLQTEHKKVSESFKGSTMNNLRMELRQTTVEIADLTIQYRSMSDEERRSAAGRQLQDKLFDLTQKAGEMRDAMGDANAAVAAVASDTHNFDALAGGLNVVSSSIGAVTGAAALFGAKEEELAEIQTKLQASLAISNALSVIQNNLQKESSLLIGVTSVQKNALIAAENLEVAAKGKNVIVTKAATVAQAALNLVAKANPYVLLAGAIISVVGALALMAKGSKEAEEAERKRKEEAEKLEEQQKHMADTLGTASGNLTAKYKVLQKQWKQLSTEQEKTKWLNNNANAFKELGLKVKGVADAENVLVKMAPQVIAALKAVAEAEAYSDLYKQAIVKRATEWEHRTKSTATGDLYTKVGKDEYEVTSMHTPDEWLKAGLQIGNDYTGSYAGEYSGTEFKLTQAGIDKINEYRRQQAIKLRKDLEAGYNEEVDFYEKKWEEAEKKAAVAKSKIPSSLLDDGGGSGSSGNKPDKPNTDTSKYLDEKMRQQREQAQHEKELELSTRQAQIDMMEEGTEKTRAQIKLDFDRRTYEIEKGYEELRQKKIDAERKLWEANPANANKPFDQTKVDVTPTTAEQQNYEVEVQANIAEYQKKFEQLSKQEAQSMRDYLKEYGTFQQKRLAIAEEYEKKIADAQNDGDRLRAAAERRAEEARLQMEAIESSFDWEAVFNDLDHVSTKALRELRDKLRTELNAGNILPENAEILSGKILEMENKIAERTSVWASLIPALKERERITAKISHLEENAAKAQKDAIDAQANLSMKDFAARDKIEQATGKSARNLDLTREISDILKDLKIDENNAKYKEVREALEKLKQAASDSATAIEKSARAQQLLDNQKNILKMFGGKGLGKLGDIFSQAVESGGGGALGIINLIGTNLSSMADFTDKIGLAGTAFGDAVHGFSDGVGSFQGAISSLASGDVFGFVGGIFDGVASIGEGFGLWSNSNVEESEAQIDRLTKSNAELGKALDDLREEMKDINLSDTNTYKKAQEVANAQIMNGLRVVQTKMGEYSGHHSTSYYSDYAASLLADLAREGIKNGAINGEAFGTNGHSLSYNLASFRPSQGINTLLEYITPEDLDKLRTFDPDGWIKFMDALRAADKADLGAADTLLEYVDTYSDLMQEIEDQWKETVTNLSWDSLKSSFSSALSDMTKDIDSWSGDLDDIFRSGVSNYLSTRYTNSDDGKLAQWYEKYFKAMESGNLSSDEIAALREEYLAIVREATQERDRLYETLELDNVSQQDQQSATSNSTQNISYDQADSLVGIGTAIQIAIEQEKSFNSNIFSALLTATETNSTHLSNIVTAFDFANNYLLDIRDFMKYIKSSVDVIKDNTYLFSKIEENTR